MKLKRILTVFVFLILNLVIAGCNYSLTTSESSTSLTTVENISSIETTEEMTTSNLNTTEVVTYDQLTTEDVTTSEEISTIMPTTTEDDITSEVETTITEQTYIVSFNSNGGTSVASQTLNIYDLVSEPSEPIREGYSFDGWYLNDWTVWSFDESLVLSDITLYAKWTANNDLIVLNGDFGENQSNWMLVTGFEADGLFEVIDEVAVVQVYAPVTTTWGPRLQTDSYYYEEGKTYTVTFDAKANASRSIGVEVAKLLPEDPWEDRFMPGDYQLFDILTEWQTFTFTFTMNHVSDYGQLLISLGIAEGNVGIDNLSTTVFFDNVKIEEVTEELTYDTIELIKQSPTGTYTTRGIVAETTSLGILITENDFYIYVYLNETPNVSIGDYVEVTGTTGWYGDALQFNSGSVVTKLSTQTYSNPPTSLILNGTDITELTNEFTVGEYVTINGILSISGNYINLTMDGTNVIGSLLNPNIDFSQYAEETVDVTGYILYISGSTTHYLNLLVTEVETSIVESSFDLTILSVNDLHGYITQDDDGTGGISNMAYLIELIRAENPLDDVVLIGNGDMFQGTAISNMTQGLAVIEVMNMMAFDAIGIGNHEFDWGLDVILQYFDGETTNGEADFSMLNANIYLNADNSLLADEDGNIYQYVIVEREGVQVGIISYIGNVYSSISYDKAMDYYFDNDIISSVETIATTLRNSGVDIIVVNIHDGNADGIQYYSYNVELAGLQDSYGNYLVDVVINGHTHSYQSGEISRANGTSLIVVQAGGNGNAFGEVVLTLNTANMLVTDYSYQIIYTSSAGTNYDSEIEAYIQTTLDSLDNTVLAVAGETVEWNAQLQDWSANVLLAATGADVAISNTGGLRSNGNIIVGENVTLAQLYEIFPFDNTVWMIELTYDEIQVLLDGTPLYYGLADGVTLQASGTYQVAISSYIYYWNQLDDARSSEDINTGLYIRDLLVEDVRIKGDNGELFSPISNPEASIETIFLYPL